MNTIARSRWLIPGLLILALAACSSAPKKPGASSAGSSKPSAAVVQGKGVRRIARKALPTRRLLKIPARAAITAPAVCTSRA